MAACRSREAGPLLIIAGAGSGKTGDARASGRHLIDTAPIRAASCC